MRNIGYIQWLNQNSLRAYPLSEISTQLSDSGEVFPSDFILDASIMMEEPAEAIYVSSVSFTANTFSIALSQKTGVASTIVYMGTFLKKNIIPYNTYSLSSMQNFGCATLVLGNTDYTNKKYTFNSSNQTAFEDKCITLVKPIPLVSIARLNGLSSETLDGVITLKAGSNNSLDTRKAYRVITDEVFCGIYIESPVYNNESHIANALVALPIFYHERFFESPDYQYVLMYSGYSDNPSTAKWRILKIEASITDWKIAPVMAEMITGLHPIHGVWNKVMTIESANIVFVVSSTDTALQFLGPCDNLDPKSVCGGYPLRFLNDASGDVTDHKLTLKVGLPTVKRKVE